MTSAIRLLRITSVLSWLAMLMVACGGGGGDGGDGGGTGPTPSFTLSVSPSTVDLLAGSSASLSVSIARTGGFAGAISVSAEGLPSGVTASTATVAAGATSANVTLTATSNVVAGTSSITLRGSGSGVSARTTTLSLTVVLPPSISLALAPANVAIEAGTSQATTLNITRIGGFAGAVTLTSSGAPAPMFITFDPSVANTASSAVNVEVGLSVPAGVYPITITGTGTGVPNVTVVLTVTVTEAVTPRVTINPIPKTLSINQGQNGNSTLNISRINYTGAVLLTTTGTPSGMQVVFNPASATGNSSAMTVMVRPEVTPGTYVVEIKGTSPGLPDANNTITVTVVSLPPAFTMALASSGLSIERGTTANTNLTLTRTNFSANVQFSATGAPGDVDVTFTPSSTTGNTATVNVEVRNGATAGTYPLIIHATAQDVPSQSVPLTLTVTSAGSSGNVSFAFCAASGMPLWLAVQNEGGNLDVIAPVGGTYTFTINPRGQVFWVMPDGAKTKLEVMHGSTQDFQLRGSSFCRNGTTTKTVNGTAASIGVLESATFAMGGGSTTLAATGGPFQLLNVRSGLQDLIATRAGLAAAPSVNSIVVVRDLNVNNNGSVGTVDMNDGVAPTSATATLTNLGADNATVISTFLSKNGTTLSMFSGLLNAATSVAFKGVPSGSTIVGDLHMLSATALPSGNSTGFPYRSVTQFNRFAADRTLDLPPFMPAPPVIDVFETSPYVQINVRSPQNANYNKYWAIVFTPTSGTVSSMTVSGTSGYFGSAQVDMEFALLQNVGFNSAWALQPGIPVNWNFIASGGSAWSGGTSAQPLEGTVSRSAGVSGTFTP